ncbi:Fe-S oxidoreductase [Sphingobium sufflavum]|uniref:Fe-S oxidoreductase n=1 Tax=Sphingobium sufflavum TaxID=1129547 RepID=UPI001F222FA6|nr:Fe-S oxidoreductase [Sphingobium sufflavum]MCE7797038.1 Fe-S oxidoreductase [Sphingobium sufflavum]
MNSRMIATALLMAGLATAPGMAQDAPPAPQPPVSQPPASTQPVGQPPLSQPPADDSHGGPGAGPNGGAPDGAVPPSAGAMTPADPSVPPNPTAPVGSAANPVVVGGNLTAPPAAPKDYPVCTKTITDSCVNRSEAGKARKR